MTGARLPAILAAVAAALAAFAILALAKMPNATPAGVAMLAAFVAVALGGTIWFIVARLILDPMRRLKAAAPLLAEGGPGALEVVRPDYVVDAEVKEVKKS